jgi:hypothetical protein
MKPQEIAIVAALAVMNLAGGLIIGVLLAKGFSRLTDRRNHFFRYFAIVLGLYFFECIAFAWGMCTQVFSVAISILWGILFGMWLKSIAPRKQIIRQMLFVSLYGCLPTISFSVVITAFWIMSGNGLLNVEQASNFGIPDFVPFPLNTVFGFCVALAAGTIILKTAFATGITSLIIRKD